MLTLKEFGDLRYLWLVYHMQLKHCYHYIEKDNKRIMTNIDVKHTRQCRKRLLAVHRALKCLIASHPAEIFAVFVCPTVFIHHMDDLTRHDSA